MDFVNSRMHGVRPRVDEIFPRARQGVVVTVCLRRRVGLRLCMEGSKLSSNVMIFVRSHHTGAVTPELMPAIGGKSLSKGSRGPLKERRLTEDILTEGFSRVKPRNVAHMYLRQILSVEMKLSVVSIFTFLRKFVWCSSVKPVDSPPLSPA